MSIEFYDVRKKEKVQVPESAVKKVKFEREKKDGGISVRYGFKAEFEGIEDDQVRQRVRLEGPGRSRGVSYSGRL